MGECTEDATCSRLVVIEYQGGVAPPLSVEKALARLLLPKAIFVSKFISASVLLPSKYSLLLSNRPLTGSETLYINA